MQISHMAILLLFMRILVVFVFLWSVLWSYLHYHWDNAFNLLSSEDIIVVGDISLQLGGSANHIMDDILLSTIFISMVILLFDTSFQSFLDFFWNPSSPFMKLNFFLIVVIISSLNHWSLSLRWKKILLQILTKLITTGNLRRCPQSLINFVYNILKAQEKECQEPHAVWRRSFY